MLYVTQAEGKVDNYTELADFSPYPLKKIETERVVYTDVIPSNVSNTHTHSHVCMHTHTHAHSRTHTHVHTHTRAHEHTHTRTCMHHTSLFIQYKHKYVRIYNHILQC